MEEIAYTVDAADRPIGRVATEAASILLGKHSTDFTRNNVAPVRVSVVNADKLKISEKKRTQKDYQRFSGYPGGLKIQSLQDLINKKGYEEVLRKAIYGMLPSNKLRAPRMQRVEFTK